MEHAITFLISIMEWIALLTFPIILLGYSYRKYFFRIIGMASILSLLSLLLHYITIPVPLIVGLQITIILFLVKLSLKANFLEALFNTSIGYGFYVLTQLIFIEIMSLLFKISYFQFFFTLNIKTTLQVITFTFVLTLCYMIYHFKFHLEELRNYIRFPATANKKYKKIIIINSILPLILICLATFTMLAEELSYKYVLILAIIIIIFVILIIFTILHHQFQAKRLIEAKKFYLDQEQQVATIVDIMKETYGNHFQAIFKLAEHQTPELINKYVETNQLRNTKFIQQGKSTLRADLINLDELLFAFLVNKRKLAQLLGVTIKVSSKCKREITTTLQQIRYLSSIIDEIILILYQKPAGVDKTMKFEIESTDEELLFKISCPLFLSEKENDTFKLFDGLMQFKKLNATIHSELKPLLLLIRCPLT